MMDKPNRILIVDDEESNRLLYRTMLTRLGYEVIEAANGKVAVEKACEQLPSLILMDVRMPVMDGLEATRQIKNDPHAKLIPIVIISSLSEVKDRERALEVGVDDFMSKPVDRIELQARVSSLVKMKKYNDYMVGYQKQMETEVAHRLAQLKHCTERNKQASLDLIIRLSQVAEYCDKDAAAHVVRVGFYASAIARKMDLSASECEGLLYAAPLHDIGKIAVPEKILMKPTQLDPGEWEIIKLHPKAGGDILKGSDSDITRMAETIALTHHEKWDGTGYPNGLQGEKIPKVGRIVALADVFDSLTTRRPYREAFTFDKALTILLEMASTHFDPQVTAAFFGIIDQIVEVRKNNDDSRSPASLLQHVMAHN